MKKFFPYVVLIIIAINILFVPDSISFGLVLFIDFLLYIIIYVLGSTWRKYKRNE